MSTVHPRVCLAKIMIKTSQILVPATAPSGLFFFQILESLHKNHRGNLHLFFSHWAISNQTSGEQSVELSSKLKHFSRTNYCLNGTNVRVAATHCMSQRDTGSECMDSIQIKLGRLLDAMDLTWRECYYGQQILQFRLIPQIKGGSLPSSPSSPSCLIDLWFQPRE